MITAQEMPAAAKRLTQHVNTVKLKLPTGKTNDWGQEGYCVPITR